MISLRRCLADHPMFLKMFNNQVASMHELQYTPGIQRTKYHAQISIHAKGKGEFNDVYIIVLSIS